MDDLDQAEEQRRAEATQWFARLKTRPVSKGTLEDFFAWQRDPANAEAFAEAELLWDKAGDLQGRPAMLRLTQEALARGGKSRPRRAISQAIALSGGVVLVLAAAGALVLSNRATDYTTRVGEQNAVALADGSNVRLATDTSVGVKLKHDERRIALDHGEALFEVAHDTSRPFVVSAGRVEVVATGTRFDVRQVDEQTRVTLFAGGVDIREKGATLVHLRPGQSWQSDGAGSSGVRIADVKAALAWTEGRLVFDKVSLSDAIREVNRYSDRKIILGTSQQQEALISGSFKAGDIDAFAAAAAAMLGLAVERQPDGSVKLGR